MRHFVLTYYPYYLGFVVVVQSHNHGIMSACDAQTLSTNTSLSWGVNLYAADKPLKSFADFQHPISIHPPTHTPIYKSTHTHPCIQTHTHTTVHNLKSS